MVGRVPRPVFLGIGMRLYTDLKVIINVEGEKVIIPQTSGVRQGDNFSPVVFLFLMSAVAESLDSEWQSNGIEKVECKQVEIEELNKGVLTGQPANRLKTGTTFNILEILYIDDGAFIFNSRLDLEICLNVIRKQFAKFGLEVHVGTNEKESKTKCVYFPEPKRFAPAPCIQAEAITTRTRSPCAPNASLIKPRKCDVMLSI
jgi:hypothetical protein